MPSLLTFSELLYSISFSISCQALFYIFFVMTVLPVSACADISLRQLHYFSKSGEVCQQLFFIFLSLFLTFRGRSILALLLFLRDSLSILPNIPAHVNRLLKLFSLLFCKLFIRLHNLLYPMFPFISQIILLTLYMPINPLSNLKKRITLIKRFARDVYFQKVYFYGSII